MGEGGFREIAYEVDPGAFSRHGIGRVPTVASVGVDGVGWRAEGVPSTRALRRWFGGP